MAKLCDIGLVGLGVMGQNLALNIADKGFQIAVYNRTASKVDETVERAKKEGNLPLQGQKDVKLFVQSLKTPRRIIILVKAGTAVDQTINSLLPHLAKNDLIIDGGNEWYRETEKRIELCHGKGFRYMGMGVSGGEEGARHGPSLMPGGTKEGYDDVKHILTKIAAQVDDGPCVSYVGPGGSGNYVKMVHNGIEYGDMQLIAEAYDVLKRIGHLTNEDLHATFREWNAGELQSFLIELTSSVFLKKDDVDSSKHMVDVILDSAGSKGTGKWTIQEAAERGVPCPTMQAALDMRYLSGLKDVRQSAQKAFPSTAPAADDKQRLITDVRQALLCSKICSYAQGLMLLKATSTEMNWNLNLGEISRTWKGGCIIRAIFLDKIKAAFERNPKLHSLLVDQYFADKLKAGDEAWRRVVSKAQASGIPVPAFSASLNYFDTCKAVKLPMNLVQAQRDFFGAHTFERVDKAGVFHADWTVRP